MFSKIWTKKSTADYSDSMGKLKRAVKEADAIVIGSGSGLSASAGFTYSGERFEKYFGDFIEKYHIRDMYSGGFYPYSSLEEYWHGGAGSGREYPGYYQVSILADDGGKSKSCVCLRKLWGGCLPTGY